MKQFHLIIIYVLSVALAAVGGYHFHAYQYVTKQEADAKSFFDIGINESAPATTHYFGMHESKKKNEKT